MLRFKLALAITGRRMLCLVTGCGSSGLPTGTAPVEFTFSDAADVCRAPAASESAVLSDSASEFGAVAETESYMSGRLSVKDRFIQQSGRQSGILTAGNVDDVANYFECTAFIKRYRHQATASQLPLNADLQQTVISVVDGRGQPLGDARCVVKESLAGQQSERVLLDMRTVTDGRVLLLSNFFISDPHQQSRRLHLQVSTDQNRMPVIDEYREVGGVWDVSVRHAESHLPTQLDLALVIDTTGSMGVNLSTSSRKSTALSPPSTVCFPKLTSGIPRSPSATTVMLTFVGRTASLIPRTSFGGDWTARPPMTAVIFLKRWTWLLTVPETLAGAPQIRRVCCFLSAMPRHTSEPWRHYVGCAAAA